MVIAYPTEMGQQKLLLIQIAKQVYQVALVLERNKHLKEGKSFLLLKNFE